MVFTKKNAAAAAHKSHESRRNKKAVNVIKTENAREIRLHMLRATAESKNKSPAKSTNKRIRFFAFTQLEDKVEEISRSELFDEHLLTFKVENLSPRALELSSTTTINAKSLLKRKIMTAKFGSSEDHGQWKEQSR